MISPACYFFMKNVLKQYNTAVSARIRDEKQAIIHGRF
jgi:hypothetical protein